MSNEFIKQHSDIWREKPSDLLSEYKYKPKLTKKLDAIHTNKTGIDRRTLYEIVLWKTNRFPEIDDDLIADLKSLATLEQGQHECAKNILEGLLRTNGVALPMASTILRFANPKTFQIIDDRAYRVIFPGEKKYPSKPANCSDSYFKKFNRHLLCVSQEID